MQILDKPISKLQLKSLPGQYFDNMVKAVVDVDRGFIALDAELHSDLESLLLQRGSNQRNLWGINFYLDTNKENFIEYDSMINLKPSQNNRSRGVENEDVRKKIVSCVEKWIKQ